MAEELKACPLPFCGGPVQFHKDDDCAGCHLIECQSCKTLFDLATKADPYNQAGSVEELQRGIAYLWNLPSQLPSQGGEAVAWQVVGVHPKHRHPHRVVEYTEKTAEGQAAHWRNRGCTVEVTPLYTHPADQVADDLTMVKVSRELLGLIEQSWRVPNGWPKSVPEHVEARIENGLAELRALLAKTEGANKP